MQRQHFPHEFHGLISFLLRNVSKQSDEPLKNKQKLMSACPVTLLIQKIPSIKFLLQHCETSTSSILFRKCSLVIFIIPLGEQLNTLHHQLIKLYDRDVHQSTSAENLNKHFSKTKLELRTIKTLAFRICAFMSLEMASINLNAR